MKDLTKMEEILLVAICRLGDDAYGVKIRKYIVQLIDKDFTYGNLYSALNQLLKKKYVDKTLGESIPARRGRPKIYYSLSPRGVQALKTAVELNQKLWAGISRLVPFFPE